MLEGSRRPAVPAPLAEGSDRTLEIRHDPAAERSESGLSVSTEASESEIDPLELALTVPLAQVAAPQAGGGLSGPDKPAGPAASFETALVEHVVRRVVWGGDRRRGVARLELEGDYAGTTIWVRGEGRVLEVDITLGAGPESLALPARLLERLRARGLDVVELNVR